MITPSICGNNTLKDYIHNVLMPLHMAHYVFACKEFSDLPRTDWGYTCEFLNGANGISVRVYRHLSSNEFSVRSMDVECQWSTNWKRILTNDVFEKAIVYGQNEFTAMQCMNGNIGYRLQLSKLGSVSVYKSTDGGETWPTFKNINPEF